MHYVKQASDKATVFGADLVMSIDLHLSCLPSKTSVLPLVALWRALVDQRLRLDQICAVMRVA
jgi:hypothetical protein